MHEHILAWRPAIEMTKRKKATSSVTRTRNGTSPRKEAARTTPPTLTLPAECTVSDAIALKESLLPFVDEPQPVTLDITRLQRIDTSGLQLITAFVRERTSQNRPVAWQGAAPALTTAARLLGLTSLLELPA